MPASFNQLVGEIAGGPQYAQFLPNPGGGTGTGGTGPVTNVPTGGGTTTNQTTTTPSSSSPNWLQQAIGYMVGAAPGCGIGDFFLRIAFFVLGFIAIIGAIYLYRGNNAVLSIPGRIARGTVRAGTHVLKAAAETDE